MAFIMKRVHGTRIKVSPFLKQIATYLTGAATVCIYLFLNTPLFWEKELFSLESEMFWPLQLFIPLLHMKQYAKELVYSDTKCASS